MKLPAAFDDYAARYDRHFTESVIGQHQRSQVWSHLTPLLQEPKNILEINCGTGADAIRLARSGHRVIATDASPAMIEQGRSKAGKLDQPVQLQFLTCAFDSLAEQFSGRQFDLVFSNFGGLNCIDPLASTQLSSHLSGLLRPGGELFLVYMSSNCLWEKWYYRYKGDLRKARRRQSPEPAVVHLDGREAAVWYYHPSELQRLYSAEFYVKQIRPVGLFVPPSYLEGFFLNKKGLLNSLQWLDTRIGSGKLANFADHFTILLQKKGF